MVFVTTVLKNIYGKNYNVLPTEITEDLNKWEDISYLWIRGHNFVKMEMLPELIYRLSTTFRRFLFFQVIDMPDKKKIDADLSIIIIKLNYMSICNI